MILSQIIFGRVDILYTMNIYRVDTETEGSTTFRDPKALGCSDRAQRGHY